MKWEEGRKLGGYTTFGIGGPATYLVEVKTIDELVAAIQLSNEKKCRRIVLGKGSNTLFDDLGFDGLVIVNKIDFLEENESGFFRVGAGYSFSRLGTHTAKKGWAGLEFASGIPGSVGGAVFMNAGANGQETSDCLVSVEAVDEQGAIKVYRKDELEFSYRTSRFQKNFESIVAASFQLVRSGAARQRQIDLITYRKNTQPYGDRSAGCVFRNPDCSSAGAVIDQAGLKGLRVGGAEVSQMHANFIVNRDGATSNDVLELIECVRKEVKRIRGIDLESEVRYIPQNVNQSDHHSV
jgi:UDP-N-acetylmuramate dehydrogenase